MASDILFETLSNDINITKIFFLFTHNEFFVLNVQCYQLVYHKYLTFGTVLFSFKIKDFYEFISHDGSKNK